MTDPATSGPRPEPGTDAGSSSAPARAVVLAAGSASRMGRPKATLMWRGRPLLEHVFAVADASQLDGGVVVLGHAASQIRAAVVLPEGFRLALNPEHASGQASSLQRGLGALDDAAGAAVVLLGDQPTLSAEAIDAVVGEWRGGAGPVVRARYRDGPGHPVLFDRSVWPRLAELAGDTGARPLLEAHPELLVETSLDADAPPDVDTWADYRALTGR